MSRINNNFIDWAGSALEIIRIKYGDSHTSDQNIVKKEEVNVMKNQENCLFTLSDPATVETYLKISSDFKLEINEKFTKDEVAAKFWEVVNQWNPNPSQAIKNKILLIKLYKLLENILNDKCTNYMNAETLQKLHKLYNETKREFF